jgi:transcriptional regulator with GAF, ATPase, and Fis domain
MLMNGAQSIAVCAGAPSQLEGLIRVVRQAGGWTIFPIQWPNRTALQAVRRTANAFVLHHAGGSGSCEELVELLRSRPQESPLIVIGREPASRAAPSCWLPELPPPALLGALLKHLWNGGLGERGAGSEAPSPIRRKTDMIIGASPAIRQLHQALDQLAPAQTPVMVTGESGVGKELVARALHFGGPRAAEPFVAINCAAIPENLVEAELFGYQRGAFTGAVQAHAGAFETAHKGTLFLDEIGELPRSMQAKLLRVLETGEVKRIGATASKQTSFRIVSATNRDLDKEVKAARFREDLYYRVRVYPLHVPPLRERPEDIAPIAAHYLSAIARRENRRELRLTGAALEAIHSYHWPGNVRELVNVLERAALHAENQVIDAQHLMLDAARADPERGATALVPYKDAKTKFEQDYYRRLMRVTRGNVSLAAKLGHKTRKEIYDALRRLGLDATAYRSDGD